MNAGITPVEMTEEEYKEHVNNDEGLCLNCGCIRVDFTEPDAEDYPCDECGEDKVMAIEMALACAHIKFVKEVQNK